MRGELDPIVGNWYARRDKGERFLVNDVNEDDGVIEIQHFDGDVEEIAAVEWRQMDLELAEPPEDWTGAMDNVERDDGDS